MSIVKTPCRIAGLGDIIVSNDTSHTITAFALASCVAVVAYHPAKQVAGLIHVVLPNTYSNGFRVMQPGYYAVTGVPLLLREMCIGYGCIERELTIQVYGGAQSSNPNDLFRIGERNVRAVKQILWKLNLPIHKLDVGGYVSRTVEIGVGSGAVSVITRPLHI